MPAGRVGAPGSTGADPAERPASPAPQDRLKSTSPLPRGVFPRRYRSQADGFDTAFDPAYGEWAPRDLEACAWNPLDYMLCDGTAWEFALNMVCSPYEAYMQENRTNRKLALSITMAFLPSLFHVDFFCRSFHRDTNAGAGCASLFRGEHAFLSTNYSRIPRR
jgi:hypothetical protein